MGESFNGRTAGLHPANEGSIPSSSTSSPGWPLRSRRRSEKPDTHVRLVLLAPDVTVAECLGGRPWICPRGFNSLRSPQLCWEVVQRPGRGSLKPATAVRVCPSQPESPRGRRSTDQDTRLRTGRVEVQLLPPTPFRGSSPNWTGHSLPKAEIPVRPRTGRPELFGA